jgi:structural maintenance of chromosomes protein 6
LKAISDELKKENRNLEKAQKEIADANAVLAQDAQREQVRASIEAAKKAYNEAEERVKKLNVETGRAKETVDAYRRELSIIEREFADVQQRTVEAEGRRDQLREATRGKGGPMIYGPWMPQVLSIIQNTRWVGEMPVGPFGRHVKLKDKKWARVLRVGIGNFLGGFAVTNHKDRVTLKKILDDKGA